MQTSLATLRRRTVSNPRNRDDKGATQRWNPAQTKSVEIRSFCVRLMGRRDDGICERRTPTNSSKQRHQQAANLDSSAMESFVYRVINNKSN